MPPPTVDLLGKTFSYLEVIGWNGYKRTGNARQKLSRWLCQCKCGEQVEVEANALQNGRIKSCGCLAIESAKKMAALLGRKNQQNPGSIAARQLFARYKNDARRRNLPFELSYDQAMKLYASKCAYCSIDPHTINTVHGTSFVYNGIDRVDNLSGYTQQNSVACCKRCNEIKRNRTYEDFADWVERAYSTMFGDKNAELCS